MLDVRNLKVTFPLRRGALQAVRGVSFTMTKGEVLGIVGESGSGKSVTAQALMRLLPVYTQISGDILFQEQDVKTTGKEGSSPLQGQPDCHDFSGARPILRPPLQYGKNLPGNPEAPSSRRNRRTAPGTDSGTDAGSSDSPARRPDGQLSPPVFRRPAPEDDDSPGLGIGSGPSDCGRTHYGPGCDDSGPDHRAPFKTQSLPEHGNHFYQPRSGSCKPRGRQDPCDVRRPL